MLLLVQPSATHSGFQVLEGVPPHCPYPSWLVPRVTLPNHVALEDMFSNTLRWRFSSCHSHKDPGGGREKICYQKRNKNRILGLNSGYSLLELVLTQYPSHWTSLVLPYFVNVPESSGPMAPFWLFSIIPTPHNLEATLLVLKIWLVWERVMVALLYAAHWQAPISRIYSLQKIRILSQFWMVTTGTFQRNRVIDSSQVDRDVNCSPSIVLYLWGEGVSAFS